MRWVNVNLADEIANRVLCIIKSQLSKQLEDALFTVETLAEYLQVSKQWVYEKVHCNEIPYYKVGKYPRFRKSKIDKWLKERERGNGKTNKYR